MLLHSLLLHTSSSDASLKTKSHSHSMAAPGCQWRPSCVVANHTTCPTYYPCRAWRSRSGGTTRARAGRGEEMSILSAVCSRFFAGVESSHLPSISSMTGAVSERLSMLNFVSRRKVETEMHLFSGTILTGVFSTV